MFKCQLGHPTSQRSLALRKTERILPAGTVIDGSSYGTSTSTFPFPGDLNGTGNSAGDGPKAYLNWLVFDRDYNLILGKSGYKRMTTAARETGQDVAHEKLTGTVTIGEAGYVYIYFSNEEGAGASETYWDDLKVTHIKSPVVAGNDYYPFGLTFNSYTRENSVANQYLYNGKELQDELNLGWLDYGARMYDASIARWLVPDLLSELQFGLTPYRYCYNNPINFSDPFGLWEQDAKGNYSTNDEKDIARFYSYLQIENSIQKKSANIEQINEFIGEEKSGNLGRLSDGSKLMSDVSIKGYANNNVRIDWFVNKKEMSNAWHEVQGQLTPDDLDPSVKLIMN